MKRKPWPIILLALIHIFAPVGSLILNALRSGRSPREQWTYWIDVLPPIFPVIYVVLPILAGIMIYMCKRWSYFFYIAIIVTILASNFYSFLSQATPLNLALLVAMAIIDILVVAYFMLPTVRSIYFDPRMRWWESLPRYNYKNAAQVDSTNVEITNISGGGLLYIANVSFEIGKSLQIKWQDSGQEFSAEGKVVYTVHRGESYCVGFKFDEEISKKDQLRSLINRLEKDGHIITDRLPGEMDSFGYWFKNLFKTGKGLVP